MSEFTLSSKNWQEELVARIDELHGVQYLPLEEIQSEEREDLAYDENYYALEPFAIGVEETGGKLPVLHESFKVMLSQRSERVSKLKTLVSAYGIDLDGSKKSLVDLNSFFILNLSSEPGETYMAPAWREFCFDTGTYLGELKIERGPDWEWVAFDDKRNKGSPIYHQIGLKSEEPPAVLTVFDNLLEYANQTIQKGIIVRDDLFNGFHSFVVDY